MDTDSFQINQQRPLTTAEITMFSNSRDAIERSVHGLNQILPSGTVKPAELLQIAEAKRLCTLLYLRERLGDLPIAPSTCPVSSATLDASSTAYKNALITTIISLISMLPDSSTLLWPLYVVGNSQLDEEQRRFVSERLRNIERERNLGSVRQARLAVEEEWKRSDLGNSSTTLGALRQGRQRTKLISLA